jgi:hypothetical protein
MKYHTREGDYCSDECIQDAIIFPDRNGVICRKENLQFSRKSVIAIFYELDEITLTELDEIRESFKEINSENINNWINQISKKYPNILKVYKVPADLTGYRYADVNRWSAAYVERTRDDYYVYMYNRSYRSNDIIEHNIQALRNHISLLDYLKGGGN